MNLSSNTQSNISSSNILLSNSTTSKSPTNSPSEFNLILFHNLDITIKVVALFYLVIISTKFNFPVNCMFVQEINKNYIITGFVLFYLLVILVDTVDFKDVSPLTKILYAFWCFLVFMITNRLDYKIFFIALTFIFLTYFIHISKGYYNSHNQEVSIFNNIIQKFNKNLNLLDLLNDIQTFNFFMIAFVLIIGFICYAGELKYKYKNMTLLNIITDKRECQQKWKHHSLFENFQKGLSII